MFDASFGPTDREKLEAFQQEVERHLAEENIGDVDALVETVKVDLKAGIRGNSADALITDGLDD